MREEGDYYLEEDRWRECANHERTVSFLCTISLRYEKYRGKVRDIDGGVP